MDKLFIEKKEKKFCQRKHLKRHTIYSSANNKQIIAIFGGTMFITLNHNK